MLSSGNDSISKAMAVIGGHLGAYNCSISPYLAMFYNVDWVMSCEKMNRNARGKSEPLLTRSELSGILIIVPHDLPPIVVPFLRLQLPELRLQKLVTALDSNHV